MAYDYRNKCGSCVRMDINNCRGYNYYCSKRASYYSARDPQICYAYEYDLERDYDELEWQENRNSNCYITTIMCEILSLPDDNRYLNTLREFRNNVLQKDSKYYMILLEYDTIGPVLANHLKNDNDAIRIAKGLIKTFIAPMLIHIENNRYDDAVSLYKSMVNLLKSTYGITDKVSIINEYNATLGGHGYILKKKQVK